MNLIKRLIFIYILLLPLHAAAQNKPLLADVASHEIVLHTAFKGMELMVFGARNEAGDVVIVVRGPERFAIVRRKEQWAGMWVHRAKERFSNAPTYYRMASSRPLEEMVKSPYFEALGIGGNAALRPRVPNIEQNTPLLPNTEAYNPFSQALLQHLAQKGLYAEGEDRVEFIGDSLFRATIPFPDTTPRGEYTVEVYLFSDGELVASQISPIHVYKKGMDAMLYNLAHEASLMYGMLSIALALSAGWRAGRLFGR